MSKRLSTKEGTSFVSRLLVPLSGTLAFVSIISFQIYAEEGMVFRVLLLCTGLGISLMFLFLSPTGRNFITCLLYTSPSPRDTERSRMPSSA